jgi:hypothetical protein
VGVLLAWRVFVAVTRVETAWVFHPVSLGLLRERLYLWDEIGGEMAKLALDPGNWGLALVSDCGIVFWREPQDRPAQSRRSQEATNGD